KEFVLEPRLRAAVRFEVLNLNLEAPNFWRPGAFDVIFARNVLMYFSRPALHAALGRMTRSLAPDGYLFLGHSESLRELTEAYQLCHTHDTFYYHRRSAGGGPMPAAWRDEPWYDAIDKAAARVRGLTSAQPAAPPAAGAPAPALPSAVDPIEEA